MTGLHMSGAGNDFVVIDARGLQLDLAALAIRACAITGADGFLALDDSQIADFRLHFYNSDGLRGEMCGNGARCICRYAYEHGIAGEEVTIQTDAGMVYGQRISESIYRVQLNLPSVLDLHRTEDAAYVELGCPGIPHCVTEVPNLTWQMREPLRQTAQTLCHHPAFPKGANVNLFCRLDDSTVRLLTYERGVEDYTLACGTGSGATAITLWAQGKLPNGNLTVQNPGGDLYIRLDSDNGKITALFLEGPTEIVEIKEI